MAFSLASISTGKAKLAPRIVLLGGEKLGKSTAAAEAPSPIFLPMKLERGLSEIDAPKFPPISTYTELLDALGVLYREEHGYKTVVIDSISALEPIIHDYTANMYGVDSIEKVLGGFGKGYTESLKVWRELLDGLDALRDDRGMGSILIGHVLTKDINDPEVDNYTSYIFDMNGKAANVLYRWADAVLFCAYKRAFVQKEDKGFNRKTARATGSGERVIYTEKRPAIPAGNRYGMPPEIPMVKGHIWQTIMQAIEKGREGGTTTASSPMLPNTNTKQITQ